MVTAAKESFKAPLPRLGTLGMFILDKFHYLQADGTPETPSDRGHGTQIGGGGTYVAVGAYYLSPASYIFAPCNALRVTDSRAFVFHQRPACGAHPPPLRPL